MPSILMVFSDPPLFPSLHWSLLELGLNATLVSERLDVSTELSPSVIVLNTFTDGPEGREALLARVRERLPGVPVIELRQKWERANESTADLCLDEPFSVEDLVAAAEHLERN